MNLNATPDVHSFVQHTKPHIFVVDFHRILGNSQQIVNIFFMFVRDRKIDINQFVLVPIVRLLFHV